MFPLRHSLVFAALALPSVCMFAQAPAPVTASSTVPAPTQEPPLTLEECVGKALDKNFDVLIQRFSTDNAKDSLDIAKSTFDPTIALTTTTGQSQSPEPLRTTDAFGNPHTIRNDRSDTTQNSLSVSDKLITGATVTAGASLDRFKSTPNDGNFYNPNYNGDYSLTVRQPLLRGAGIRYNRAAIELAKMDITRANFDFKTTVLTVIRNVESAYYSLAYTREQLNVRRFSLQVSERLLEENRAKRNTGVATDLDVLEAEVEVANARRDVLTADQAVSNAEDTLRNLISQFQFDAKLGTVALPADVTTPVSFDVSYKLARENAPDFASSQVLIEQLKIDARLAHDNRLPQFDLTGGADSSSYERSYYHAATRAWDTNGYGWNVGASLSFPWGFRADKARYRQAKTNLSREEMHLQQLDQGLVVTVRSAVRAVQTNQETTRISALATQLSEKQFELEKARYDAGLSTFRFVQQAQADLDTARVNELQSRVALRNALADLARVEGSSLVHYHINLAQ